MDPEVFLQMVLVLEGLAALCAFELAVAGRLVEQLVLQEKRRKNRSGAQRGARVR